MIKSLFFLCFIYIFSSSTLVFANDYSRLEKNSFSEALDSERYYKVKMNQVIFDQTAKGRNDGIKNNFFLASTELTQYQWAKILILGKVSDHNFLFPSTNEGNNLEEVIFTDNETYHFFKRLRPNHPIQSVSPKMILEFIKVLNQLSDSENLIIQEKLKEIIYDHKKGRRYRLPAPNEYAYVFSDHFRLDGYFGKEKPNEVLNYGWCIATHGDSIEYSSHAVKLKKPRIIDGQEFYDLEGNVEEMVATTFDGNSLHDSIKSGTISAPALGGSFSRRCGFCTTSAGSIFYDGEPDIGFRLAASE